MPNDRQFTKKYSEEHYFISARNLGILWTIMGNVYFSRGKGGPNQVNIDIRMGALDENCTGSFGSNKT